MIYSDGVYRHMSAEVAPLGIARNYVTLFIAIPLLILSSVLALKGSTKGRFMLAGVLKYFFALSLVLLLKNVQNEIPGR